MRPWLILSLLMAITACTEFPELDAKIDAAARAAPYPDLIPIEEIKAQVPPPRIADTSGRDVNARAKNLKARAARLRAITIN